MNQRWAKLLLAGVSLCFTAFVFMNTYEVVFNKDIAVADSVHQVAIQNQVNTTIQQFDIKPEAGREYNNAEFARLQRLQIPALASNLYLEEKRKINNSWYARPNLGHYLGLNKDNHGATVDYLIYAIKGWQTLPEPNQLEVGMDVKLFHDGSKLAMFRVAEKKVLSMDTTFVAGKSENRQIILLIEDPDAKLYYAFSLVQKD